MRSFHTGSAAKVFVCGWLRFSICLMASGKQEKLKSDGKTKTFQLINELICLSRNEAIVASELDV
jgi:hypothetical protein